MVSSVLFGFGASGATRRYVEFENSFDFSETSQTHSLQTTANMVKSKLTNNIFGIPCKEILGIVCDDIFIFKTSPRESTTALDCKQLAAYICI